MISVGRFLWLRILLKLQATQAEFCLLRTARFSISFTEAHQRMRNFIEKISDTLTLLLQQVVTEDENRSLSPSCIKWNQKEQKTVSALYFNLCRYGYDGIHCILSCARRSSDAGNRRRDYENLSAARFGCYRRFFAAVFVLYKFFLIEEEKRNSVFIIYSEWEKVNLARVLIWESFYCFCYFNFRRFILRDSVFKACRAFNAEYSSAGNIFSLSISFNSIGYTVVLFAVIFFLILLNTLKRDNRFKAD